MIPAQTPDPSAGNILPQSQLYHVGTLTYTRAALLFLITWLLWGDFCFILMETVVPMTLPVKLNELGAPNWVIGLLLSTIPGLLNSVVNPVSSFASDRFRSPWGRRIPFIAVSTLPLAFLLILLGFSATIGAFVHKAITSHFSQLTTTLIVMGVFMFGFQLFHMVINSVYYYLFNDVVPAELLSRFMALFRMVGILAAAAFNGFFLKYATTHFQTIYLEAGLLYLVAFSIMCIKVKEGAYPPPPANIDGRGGVLSALKTYFVECFAHRFYWLFYLANTSYALSLAVSVYALLQARSIGIDIGYYGKCLGISGVAGAALLYPAGSLSDRVHPLNILIGATIATISIQPLWLLFAFHQFGSQSSYWLFTAIVVVSVPAGALYAGAELPMYMKLLPRQRYGQFCSANALVRALALIVGGILAGALLDATARMFPASKDYSYRLIPCWSFLFLTCSLVCLLLLHRQFMRRGGPSGYRPPAFPETP